MLILENILSQEIIQKLGWTLVHFIWQAAVVALLLATLLKVLRKSTPSLRYIIACLALTLIVLLPVITIQFIPVSVTQIATHIEPVPAPAVLATEEIPIAETIVLEERVQAESVTPVYSVSWKQRTIDALEPALPYIVSGWLVGVFGLSVWHLGGWAQLQRLKRRMVKQVDDALSSKLKVLAQRLRVRQRVQLMESALVQIPTVVGWLRPVILLPASALTGLSAEQLEAILAHELAHIKRFDYLVNILQTVVEILGFYHPAVWWVSHKIRAERENCCDDLAVSISGDRVCYAGALTSMEEIRVGHGQLAVAAAGGNLFRRIRRLVSKDSTEKTSFSWIPAATAILLIAALLIPTVLALTTHNGTEHTAESLLDKIVEHRSKVKNVQFVAEYDIWHAGYSEEYVENIRKSMRERGIPEQQLQRMTRGFSRVPQSRYQILKCTIDNEERAKIERTTGTYDSSGKKLPSGDKNISAWNGVLGIDFNQRRGSTGATTFKDAPPTGASRQGHPWKTFTGAFCSQLAEAINAERQISVDELKDGTYRVVFDNDPIIKIAVIYPSQGYSCSLQESYKEDQLTYRSKAKYKEVAKGIWFPVSGQTESYAPDGSLSSKSTIETSQIKINDPAFNETFFDIDLPEGTEVRDTVQGKHYVVGSKNVYELDEPQKTSAETKEVDPNSWQQKFYSIYSLEDGELLKRIAPPFIPERRGYFLLIQPGRYSPNTPHHVARLYFNWDGKLSIRGSSVGGGIPRLNSILESVIGLGNFEYDIPSELLQIDMSGDWIVRKDTPTEALMKDLKEIVKNETAREIDFVKKKVETEVIIAKGKYDLKPLPGVKEGNYTLISTDKMDTYSGGGGGSGTVSRFLRWVGNRINMYIIDETKSEDIKIYWRNHDSSDLRRLSHNKELYNERLDILLSNLTRQTGLTFERKTAEVEKWFIAEEGAVNAPQKTEPVPAENVQDSDSQVEVKKALSTEKLKQLGLAVAMYADDHDDNLPDSLRELKPYIRDEQDFNWLLDNIKYLGSGKSAQRNAALIPIAYDRELLEEADGTNVLSLDFSVRFLDTKEFEKLDIKRVEFLIETRFLSVSEDLLQNISLDANSPDEAKDLLKLKSEMLAASDGSKTQSLILDERNVSLLLKAVRANKDSKVLSAPQVICEEDKTAEIRVFNNLHFISGYTEPNRPSDKPEPTYDSVKEGIFLSLKPKLTPNKNIDMEFELEITNVPSFEERQYKGKYPYMHLTVQKTTQATRYIAHNGQTLLFGGHKISKHKDGRTEQKDLLVLIKAQTAGSSEQDKSAQVENVTVSESTKTTSDVIMLSDIVQSRIKRPNENVQESDSQVEDDILIATEQEKELSANRLHVTVPAKSPAPSAQDRTIIQVDCLIVEVSLDSKMDRETTIIAENLLGNKISLRDTKAVVLLRKAAKATAAIKDKSAENKRVTQKQFEALVDMLTSKGYLRILMNPRIQVVDGKTAKIMSTQKISSTQESIEDSIQITPHVPGDGHIILQVEATISSKSIPKGVEQIPIITTREVSTLVTTSPGESLMIFGGLKETGKSTKPYSNVKDSEKQTTELLLILTPTIVTSTTDSQEKTDVRVKGESEVSKLLASLEDEKYAHTRGGIILLVEEIGNKEPTSFLFEQLQAESRRRRCKAALVLELLGDRRGVPVIIKELNDTSYRPTTRIKSDGTEYQEGQFRQDHYYAALLLGILGDERAVPTLIEATRDEEINYQAAISLGQIGDMRAVPALRVMLEKYSNEPFVRLFAGYGLAMLNDQEGLRVVIDTLNNQELYWVDRRHAIRALGELRDKQAVPHLIVALKDDHPNIRVSAARALGAIGGLSALPALEQALEDKTETKVNAPTTVSKAAAEAIAQIRTERRSDNKQEKTKSATEQKPQMVQKLFPLQHHDASKMAQILKPLLSHTGHISTDERTNSLLVIDTAENLMRIEKIIAQFDVSIAEQAVQKSFKLKYRSPSQMAQILRPLLTKTGHVSADESTGILLLIDTPENLKRIEKIIAAFDVLQAEQTVQKFFKLKYYSTSQMAQILRPLLTKTGYISTDERINSLLVIDTVENLKRIELIITEYDVPKADETVTEIFEIHYGDPTEIVELLKKLINGRPDAGSIIEQGKEQIVLVPEPRRKWIIAKASPENMKQIGEWIAKLDHEEPAPTSLEQIDQQIIKQQKILKMRQDCINNDPVVKALSENVANAEKELIVVRQNLLPSHPEVLQKAELLQLLKKRLDDRITAVGKSFDDMMLPEPNLPLAPEVPLITNTWIESDMLEVLQDIASMSGIPIIPDEKVVGYVTAELKDVPLETALDIVLAGTPYVVKKTPYYYLVASAVEPLEIQKRVDSAKKLSNLGKALLIYANDHEDKYPDSLHHLPVYSNVEELKWVLANVKYLAYGKTIAVRPDTVIAYDKMLPAERKGTNVLFNDSHVEFVKPERLKELGISATAILITTQLLSVSEDFLKDIGLDANSISRSNVWSEHLVADSAAEPNSETYSLILDDLHISFLLKAVGAHKGARGIASPRVMVQEGKTASIAVLTEEYYVLGYTEPNRPSDEPEPKKDKVEIGTRIWLKPELTPDNENVDLDFKLEISNLKGIIEGKYQGKYPYQKPIVDVISTETRTVVPNGKTLLIGGLKINEKKVEHQSDAPRLSDLPLIGVVFSRSTKTRENKMLLVLVKPIINPQQKARKILRGQEDSEEHIKSLARQLEKKLNPTR